MTPTKIAICNESVRPTIRVIRKVMASDRVALDTVLICLDLIKEVPMKITSVASAGRGM